MAISPSFFELNHNDLNNSDLSFEVTIWSSTAFLISLVKKYL